MTYPCSDRSLAVAERLDFVARSDELAERGVATLLAVGALDDEEGFREPAMLLHRALSRRAPERTAMVQIAGMGHPLAEDPGLKPAPQTAHASRVDATIVGWLRRHLTPRTPEPKGRSHAQRLLDQHVPLGERP